MGNGIRAAVALVLSLLSAAPIASSAAQPPWTCDGNYRTLGTLNGPGIYRFRPAGGMTFRFIAESANATFSVSDKVGTTCSITCLHTNVPVANVRDCSAPDTDELIVTVANGDALAISDNPAGQPIGVPAPGPLPNDPILIDPGCDACDERLVRASDTLLPQDLRSKIVVRGEDTGDRYVVTVLVGGEQAFPPISVEDTAPLPDLELQLLPESPPTDLEVVARYHPDETRCFAAMGDPDACGPFGPTRAPRDDARWREAGLIIRVQPDGPELFLPYLGQLCAGHSAPGAPDARPC